MSKVSEPGQRLRNGAIEPIPAEFQRAQVHCKAVADVMGELSTDDVPGQVEVPE
jgi:hypothetical protein